MPKYTIGDAPAQSKYTVGNAPPAAPVASPDKPGPISRFFSSAWAPIASSVSGLYHAAVEGPQNPEEAHAVGEGEGDDPAWAADPLTRHLILAGKRIFVDPAVQQAQQAKTAFAQSNPLSLHPTSQEVSNRQLAAGHALAAALPGIGPWAAQVGQTVGEQAGTGDIAGAAGTIAGNAALAAAPKVIGKIGEAIPKVTRGAADIIAGTGPKVAEDLAAKTAEENAAAQAKADAANATLANKRAQQVQQHFEKTQQVRQANDAAQALQSRKAALNRGVEQLDPQFQEDLKATEQNVRDQANEKYNTVREALSPQSVSALPKGFTLRTEGAPQDGYYRINLVDDAGNEMGSIQADQTPSGQMMIANSRIDSSLRGQGIGTEIYTKLINDLGQSGKTLVSDVDRSPAANALWKKLEAQGRAREIPAPTQTMRAADGKMIRTRPGDTVFEGIAKPADMSSAPTVPSESLVNAVKAAESKIHGSSENLKIFRDILSKHPEGEPESITYQGAQIPKGHPLYDVLKEGNESAPATFSDLQGYYSELGDKLSSGNLPGDVYQAMKSLQGSIGDLMQKMADSKGVGDQLKDARSFYRDYMQAFRESSSPLNKAMKATESGKSIAALKGADKSGIETLARYNPELARRANTIRGYQAEANAITSRPPAIKPEPVLPPKPQPSVAEIKKIGLQDIRDAKAEKLQGKKGPAGGPLGHIAAGAGGWHMIHSALYGNPEGILTGGALAAAPYALAKVLKMPAVVKLLSEPTPADIAAIPPELSGDLPAIVKAAQKQGIKVHPAFVVMAGASNAPQQ